MNQRKNDRQVSTVSGILFMIKVAGHFFREKPVKKIISQTTYDSFFERAVKDSASDKLKTMKYI